MSWSQFIRDSASINTSYNTYQTNKKLDNLNDSLNDFKKQTSLELGKLTDTIQNGFSMLSMELAVQSQIFKNIYNVLKEKRTSEAEELKNFGLKALRNGWTKDAIEDFNKSIELNRYDYQVYYLLSKCYFLLDDIENQNNYLQKAFQYSSEDPLFRQYVGLDIVGQLVKEKKFDEAEEVVRFLESLINDQIEITPLLMCKLYIDIFSGNINEKTLQIIERAIDNYEGEDPSRIITVIKSLSHFVNEQQCKMIENKLNLKKFSIIKKYGSNVLNDLDNIEKALLFIYTNIDTTSILKMAPGSVINRFFPLYKSCPKIIDRIREFKNKIANIVIDDYDKFNFIAPIIKKIERGIFEDISNVYRKTEDDNFNTNPFFQNFPPELNFNVGEEDKILVQCKLNNNELITLTYFKLIIIDKNKKTFIYDLVDDFINVEKGEIRTEEVNAGEKKVDQITFFLKDKISDKVLLFSSSSYFTPHFGTREKHANVLSLLWIRAINNILIYLDFKSFNDNLFLLQNCIDFIGISSSNNSKSTEVQILDNLSSDVEFID
jgi:tetratricopeptide (TPR) repeat protein